MRYPAILAAAAAVIAVLGAACGGDGGGKATATPARATATRAASPAATQAATQAASTPEAPAGTPQEVTGIVGVVNAATRTIEITRTGGADVRMIEVTPATSIRNARRERVTLADVRPSNRIVASGAIDPSSGALVATAIQVQDVVSPGLEPGG